MSQNDFKNESPKYWLSLDQWRRDPEFERLAQQEFLSSPLSEEDEGADSPSRRRFLQLMGASMALGSFGCLRRPTEKIVPYADRPEEIINGKPNFYASSFVEGNQVFACVVKTREGKPLKLEGNPRVWTNEKGLGARGQAHVLSLYDPDRLDGPRRNLLNEKKTNRDTVNVDFEKLDKEVGEALKAGKSALLSSTFASPSTSRVVSQFCRLNGVKHFTWDSNGYSSVRKGQKDSYGSAVLPRLRPDRAKYILTVGSDPIATFMNSAEFSRRFAAGRKPGDDMSRLVSFESGLSVTGAKADYRFRIRPSQRLSVLGGLLHEIVVKGGYSSFASSSSVKDALAPFATAASDLHIEPELFSQIAADLWKNRGQSLIVAGTGTADDEAVQVAANFLNSVLDNDGKTIDHSAGLTTGQGSNADLMDLVDGLKSGSIETVIIHGVNPMYHVPAHVGLAEAFQKAKLIVYTGDRIDETGAYANLVAPDHHQMEGWGDLEAAEGVILIQQPTISPLYNTRAFQDSLAAWTKAAGRDLGFSSWYDHWKQGVKSAYFGKTAKGRSYERWWIDVLQQGAIVLTDENHSVSSRSFRTSALSVLKPVSSSDVELELYSKVGIGDGTYANLPWLQELPDPITKVVWDNYACVSPKMAKALSLHEGDMLKLTVDGRSIEVPAHIQPGQDDHTVSVAVGYGRTRAGKVADGIGVNAMTLAGFSKAGSHTAGLALAVAKTEAHYQLVTTQGHHTMEGRQIVVEATLEQYMKKPSAGIHKHKIFSAWEGHEYKGHRWAMTVDQSLCTGCSACVVACQAENNIPVVGKKYVLQGREMHWMRLDRYYTGDPSDPGVVFQPMLCQHCENAPCETVCPVLATVHGDEGTNDMIYNRCVGTRYCANNCPYKVRRFNWFRYDDKIRYPQQMQLNPEVTVRSRGVMEKCTFCSHKVKEAKLAAKREGRRADENGRILKTDEVQAACQLACSTGAIIFGDVNDENSEVSKHFKDPRAYAVLEEVHAKPMIHYKTVIRNSAELKGSSGHHDEGHH